MWKEFKAFAMKGNIIDLAVAVVIGAAFGKIVTSLVDNIIMPLVGIILGGIDLKQRFVIALGEAQISLGIFLQSIIDFLLIAFSIFMALRLINKLNRKKIEKEEAKPAPVVDTKEQLLKEIRDLLKEKDSI